MLDSYQIKTLDQLKALTHPLRLRILELLVKKALTTKQIAEALGEDPLKLYYHVTALEEAGLIELVETRMKANLQEKYYQAVAKSFTMDKSLFTFKRQEAAGTVVEIFSNLLDILRDEITQGPLYKALEEQPLKHQKFSFTTSHSHIQASRQTIEELTKKIRMLIEEAKQANQPQGELTYCLTILFFPIQEQRNPRSY